MARASQKTDRGSSKLTSLDIVDAALAEVRDFDRLSAAQEEGNSVLNRFFEILQSWQRQHIHRSLVVPCRRLESRDLPDNLFDLEPGEILCGPRVDAERPTPTVTPLEAFLGCYCSGCTGRLIDALRAIRVALQLDESGYVTTPPRSPATLPLDKAWDEVFDQEDGLRKGALDILLKLREPRKSAGWPTTAELADLMDKKDVAGVGKILAPLRRMGWVEGGSGGGGNRITPTGREALSRESAGPGGAAAYARDPARNG
jgi:hypothetical protein